MKKFLFALTFLFSVGFLAAQTSAAAAAPVVEDFDQAAAFPGGEAAIADFVAKNQRSLDVRRSEVETNVVVMQVVIETDGRPTTFRKVSAPNTQMEEEAVVLLKKMRFAPARKSGDNVRSRIEVALPMNLK